MHLSALRISNFRRLKSVLIDLANDISILVGSNNSGKTSTAHALQLFVNSARGENFTVHDFNSQCWAEMNAFGEGVTDAALPKITLDLWFHVEEADLHRVIDLLPGLDWQETEVGLRIEYGAADAGNLRTLYQAAKAKAAEHAKPATEDTPAYHPEPRTLTEFLTDKVLREQFGLRYLVLDRARFDANYVQEEGYVAQPLTPEKGSSGKEILSRLVRIDVLNAQRHLSDKAGGHRAEDLSRHLGRFYSRNLKKREDDHDAMRALTESESLLNQHLADVFAPTLTRLSELGYPGLSNPQLLIKSALNPVTLMSSNDDGTKVYYVLNPAEEEQVTLPDRYNGLGFKNLIYMVVELLDRHAQWMDIEEDRPPLHLVFIEEPEVHLHAQLQQVFIRKIQDILEITGDDATAYHSQFVVTTHSPHILYERGFTPIRYFRRTAAEAAQTSEVLNLSAFYAATDEPTRDFLQRYMKLTHCDLFFADAAVLVEGNVERLSLSLMIEKAAPRLRAACLSILEVGGAFAYRFKTLVEFLGLTTLVVTDLDSVSAPAAAGTAASAAVDEEEADREEPATPRGKACPVLEQGALTSNRTLIEWLPGRTTIADLLGATPEDRTQLPSAESLATIRVAYQNPTPATWGGETVPFIGRTLEEAFAFQNLAWCQSEERDDLGLRIPGNATKTLVEVVNRIHKRVKGSGFKKTDFALALLAQEPAGWDVPRYIDEGLKWLEAQVVPLTETLPPTLEEGVEEVLA